MEAPREQMLPYVVWKVVMKYLRPGDLCALFKTGLEDVVEACKEFLYCNPTAFSLKYDTSPDGQRDWLDLCGLDCLKTLGQHCGNVHFQAFSLYIKDDTFDHMMEQLATSESALRLLSIRTSRPTFFHSGTGKNWPEFLQQCDTTKDDIKITLHVAIPATSIPGCVEALSASDPRYRFLTILNFFRGSPTGPDSSLLSGPDSASSPVIVFLSKLSNLRTLSLCVSYVNDVFLNLLAQRNTALSELALWYPTHYETHDVSHAAWNNVTIALPLLRVTCYIRTYFFDEDSLDGLFRVVKAGAPVTKINATSLNQTQYDQFLCWCADFANTLKDLFVRVGLDRHKNSSDWLSDALKGLCRAVKHLRCIHHQKRVPTKNAPHCFHDYACHRS